MRTSPNSTWQSIHQPRRSRRLCRNRHNKYDTQAHGHQSFCRDDNGMGPSPPCHCLTKHHPLSHRCNRGKPQQSLPFSHSFSRTLLPIATARKYFHDSGQPNLDWAFLPEPTARRVKNPVLLASQTSACQSDAFDTIALSLRFDAWHTMRPSMSGVIAHGPSSGRGIPSFLACSRVTPLPFPPPSFPMCACDPDRPQWMQPLETNQRK